MVAVLGGMQIKHEVDESTLKLGAQPPIQGETCPRHFGSALKIKDSKGLTQFPVRLGGKGKLGDLPPPFDHRVILFILTNWNGFVGHVGNQQKGSLEFALHLTTLLVQFFDSLRDLAHTSNGL